MAQVELLRNHGREDGQGLSINVIDRRRAEERPDYPPSPPASSERSRSAQDFSLRHIQIVTASYFAAVPLQRIAGTLRRSGAGGRHEVNPEGRADDELTSYLTGLDAGLSHAS